MNAFARTNNPSNIQWENLRRLPGAVAEPSGPPPEALRWATRTPTLRDQEVGGRSNFQRHRVHIQICCFALGVGVRFLRERIGRPLYLRLDSRSLSVRDGLRESPLVVP